MAFEWTGKDWDKGGQGTFGRADYFEALRRGGTDKASLVKTRKSIQDWMGKTSSQQYINKPGMQIKDWVMKGTDLGSTMYGTGGSTADATTYGKADYFADLAQGRSSQDVRKHFTDNLANISKLGPNVFKLINEQATTEVEDSARKGQDDAVKAATDAGAAALKSTQTTLASTKDELTAANKSLAEKTAGYKTLQTKYDTELADLKRASLAQRTNAPVRVGGPGSALSIRAARGPQLKGKFRGTLGGLTRPQATSNKLKSTALNV